MSLELALEANTAATLRLTEVLLSNQMEVVPMAAVEDVVKEPAPTTPATPRKPGRPTAAEAAAKAKANSSGAAPRRQGNDTPGTIAAGKAIGTERDPAKFNYEEQVKPMLQRVAAECGRDEVLAILQRHGVAKATDLGPGAYPSVVQLCEEALTGKSALNAAEANQAEEVLY